MPACLILRHFKAPYNPNSFDPTGFQPVRDTGSSKGWCVLRRLKSSGKSWPHVAEKQFQTHASAGEVAAPRLRACLIPWAASQSLAASATPPLAPHGTLSYLSAPHNSLICPSSLSVLLRMWITHQHCVFTEFGALLWHSPLSPTRTSGFWTLRTMRFKAPAEPCWPTSQV